MAWEPDYITPAELAAFARADAVAFEADLTSACAAASRAVDVAAGRQFGKTDAPEARVFAGRWSASRGMWRVETDDFTTMTDLAWDSAGDQTFATPMVLSAVQLHPINAPQKGRPYEGFYARRLAMSLPPWFRVTADPWGWSEVPESIVAATKMQGLRFFSRRDAPFGVAGSPNDGSETRLQAKADPDVLVMVRRYARRAWAR